LPCDRGSSVTVLKQAFGSSALDFSTVPPDWNSKKGHWAATPEALAARAERVKRRLRDRSEGEIVVVTHAGFLGWLTGEEVEFGNAEWRSYRFDDGEDAVLRSIEDA
jgi:broad specificity phosphatase PhoE